MLIEEANSHLLHSIQRQNQQLVLLLTRWSWWTPTEHFKCFCWDYKGGGLNSSQNDLRIARRTGEGRGETQALNGFGEAKLILEEPLHTEPPFDSTLPLVCSVSMRMSRQITTNSHGRCEKEKRPEKPFISCVDFFFFFFFQKVHYCVRIAGV